MRVVVVVALVLASAEVRASCSEVPPSCDTLPACVETFHALPVQADNGGLDEQMQGIAAGFVALAPASIPEVLRLLDDPDPRRRNTAADVLGTLRAREAVPALLRHLDDTRWASWALGRVGDERALPALLHQLERPTGDGAAIGRFGRAGATALARALVDAHATDTVRSNAAQALTELDADVDVGDAVDVLRRALPTANAHLDHLLNVLQSFGTRAAAAIPEVRAARTRVEAREGVTRTALSTESFSSFVTMPRIADVLLALGDTAVVVEVAARFWSDPVGTHMRLAEQGPRAAAAVPILVDALERGPWRIQADAAHALGFIGDDTAAPTLVRALSSRSWVVVFESARALGRIGVDVGAEAAAHLATLRDEHWSAVVRDAADVALRRVTGEQIDEVNDNTDHRAEGGWVHGPPCDVVGDLETMQAPPDRYARVGRGWVNVSLSDVDHDDDHDDTIDSALLQRLPALAVPGDVRAVVVDGATIIGRDAGEWIGDLHVIDPRGVATKLLADNVLGLRKVGDVVVVFTGLAHMGTDEGAVFRVQRDNDGWHAVPLVALPEAPYRIRAVPHANAFVVVGERNAAIVGVDGTIEAVACRLAEPR
jgi:HEAT repeat protein